MLVDLLWSDDVARNAMAAAGDMVPLGRKREGVGRMRAAPWGDDDCWRVAEARDSAEKRWLWVGRAAASHDLPQAERAMPQQHEQWHQAHRRLQGGFARQLG